jgi:iron-regulated transporter 1
VLSNVAKDKGQPGDEEKVVVDEDSVSSLTSSEEEDRNGDCCHSTCCSYLLHPITSMFSGWKIYLRQEIALTGFALAFTYLTVLGFSGVTAAYFLTQGLRPDIIGLCQGIGAFFGILGTAFFPCLRRLIGTVRTGLFGISMQLSLLMFCIVAIVVPSNRISSKASGYYSADCSAFFDNTSNLTTTSYLETTNYHYLQNPNGSLPSPSFPDDPDLVPDEPVISSALIFMLVGVICCRTGIWLFDLSVQQLLQESVKEEERGVVNGVMKSMMCFNDMLNYVLVIAAPRPEDFQILTVISVGMVTLALIFYAAYVRKVRGHLFHFADCFRSVMRCCHGKRKDGESKRLIDRNNANSEPNKAE